MPPYSPEEQRKHGDDDSDELVVMGSRLKAPVSDKWSDEAFELELESDLPPTSHKSLSFRSSSLNLEAVLDTVERMFQPSTTNDDRSTEDTEDDDSSQETASSTRKKSSLAKKAQNQQQQQQQQSPTKPGLTRRRYRYGGRRSRDPPAMHAKEELAQEKQQQQQQQRRRKKVTFAGAVFDEEQQKVVFHPLHVVSLILHHRDYTPEEIRRAWYTRAELARMQSYCLETALAISKNVTRLYCPHRFRGLESLINAAAQAHNRPALSSCDKNYNTSMCRSSALRSVLAEQRKQKLASLPADPDAIRAVYVLHGNTVYTRRAAHSMALTDEVSVYGTRISRRVPSAERQQSNATYTVTKNKRSRRKQQPRQSGKPRWWQWKRSSPSQQRVA